MKTSLFIICVLAFVPLFCIAQGSISLSQRFLKDKTCHGDPFMATISSMGSCPSQPFCNSTSSAFCASSSESCIASMSDFKPPSTTKYMVTAIYFTSPTCQGSPTILNYAALDTCIRDQKQPDKQAGYFTCNPDGTVTTHHCNLDCSQCDKNVTMPSGCVPQMVGMITSCKPNLLLKTLKLKD